MNIVDAPKLLSVFSVWSIVIHKMLSNPSKRISDSHLVIHLIAHKENPTKAIRVQMAAVGFPSM